ncbi:MAG: metal ABC transporter permease [Verrucomicrobiae bacterium]|nr:metal ABC transporter permease [Verrucomicrobiae bacterium]
MSDAVQFMALPFLACTVLPGLLVYLGLHVVQREIVFVDLALAQVAALGSCVSVLLGHDPCAWQTYAWSFGFTLVGAGILAVMRPRDRRVPQEAVIGIVYVLAAAAAIVVLNYTVHGAEELRRMLVGEIILVKPVELFVMFGVFAAVAVAHYLFRKPLLALSFGPQPPRHVVGWDFLFYVLFGIVVTCFVHIGGVLLTFCYLVIPAVVSRLLAASLRAQICAGWLFVAMGSAAGLGVSYVADWPSGAAIVCALGFALVIVVVYKRVIRRI